MNNLKITTVALILTFLMIGCATSRPAKKMSMANIEQKYPDISRAWVKAIKQGQVRVGMTKAMVVDALGDTSMKSSVTTKDGIVEKWSYGKVSGLMNIEHYSVYLDNGKIIAIERN